MTYPNRKSPRLKGFDYSSIGVYFITICTERHKCILSTIEGGGDLDAPRLRLSSYGYIVEQNILRMNAIYEHLFVEKYVIMPNHVHLLLHITDSSKNGPSRSPAPPTAVHRESRPSNAIVPRYVATLKRFCNQQCGCNLWQRSFDDRIIRNDAMYDRVWNYIDTNPIRWTLDRYYF